MVVLTKFSQREQNKLDNIFGFRLSFTSLIGFLRDSNRSYSLGRKRIVGFKPNGLAHPVFANVVGHLASSMPAGAQFEILNPSS
jgi:hypothetical protein